MTNGKLRGGGALFQDDQELHPSIQRRLHEDYSRSCCVKTPEPPLPFHACVFKARVQVNKPVRKYAAHTQQNHAELPTKETALASHAKHLGPEGLLERKIQRQSGVRSMSLRKLDTSQRVVANRGNSFRSDGKERPQCLAGSARCAMRYCLVCSCRCLVIHASAKQDTLHLFT